MNMGISSFYNCFSSLDFSFLELVLSTFLGFGSALLVEAIVDKHEEKILRKQLLKDLKAELLSLKENIELLESDKVYIQPYTISIWKGVRECGSILCIDEIPCFFQLLEVFSSIEEANLIELKCFELYVGRTPSTDMNLILSTLYENRQYVKKQIETGLIMLNGGNN